ncbi:hypothetical protein [Streptomyces sp. S.PB5]|uniref:hypothetical protein n=1 Tax=Streptomyces sp. S.PB5 TaxID=3020844 RepID=UPI0025B07EA9|nr:hypothetical protein [Streptomyces sp. S.PB5]MDN3022614.1 hypothetical protein [Streptomyces sp. S.PB5]
MRLFTPAPVTLAAAAALLLPPAPAHAAPAPTHACAGPDARSFPLTTRIHGGPDTYEAGGGYGTWYLDLTNTTDRTCEDIHPVVVLVDRERALEPGQPQLEFYDGPRARPVRFEVTDEDELVGAFPSGLTVGPRQTRTVRIRLALTSDTVANEVTANAAVVQRHDDDGDWVGQSNDYRFAVDAGPKAPGVAEDGLRYADGAGELARTGLTAPVGTLAAAAAALLLTGASALCRSAATGRVRRGRRGPRSS